MGGVWRTGAPSDLAPPAAAWQRPDRLWCGTTGPFTKRTGRAERRTRQKTFPGAPKNFFVAFRLGRAQFSGEYFEPLEVAMPTFVLLAQVSVSPTSAGMPGAQLINQLISWLSQLALWGSLASILVGAAIY